MFDKVVKLAKDCLFPVYCLGCEKEGEWVCTGCLPKMKMKGVFCCPICHRYSNFGENCSICLSSSNVDSVIAITKYREKKLIGKVIHTLKYDWAEDVIVVIEKMVNIFVSKNPQLFQKIDYIIPVPLHAKRYVERGFNQAELIAGILSTKLDLPVNNFLVRNRQTKQQARLTREERIVNVKDTFVLKDKISGNILLIDDVFTTGSTMQECSRILKIGGAEKVIGFVVARG